MGTVRVLIAHRMQSRWEGGYTKEQFMRTVHPVFEKYSIPCIAVVSICAGRIYEGPISRDGALQFRKELERACNVLGRNLASFDYRD